MKRSNSFTLTENIGTDPKETNIRFQSTLRSCMVIGVSSGAEALKTPVRFRDQQSYTFGLRRGASSSDNVRSIFESMFLERIERRLGRLCSATCKRCTSAHEKRSAAWTYRTHQTLRSRMAALPNADVMDSCDQCSKSREPFLSTMTFRKHLCSATDHS